MKDWYKRFEFFWFKLDGEDTPPLISFSIDVFRWSIQPYAYFRGNDTNRWKGFAIEVKISRLDIYLRIPYKRLPDYVPTERQRRIRGKI